MMATVTFIILCLGGGAVQRHGSDASSDARTESGDP